jgi:membrane-bound lytic murein transglycosylase B
MRRLVVPFIACLVLSACSSRTQHPAPRSQVQSEPVTYAQPQPTTTAFMDTGDFSSNPAVANFIEQMVAKHGMDRQQLQNEFAQTKRLDWVLKLMEKQAPAGKPSNIPNGGWVRYRAKFITPDNVQNGVAFWDQYNDALQRAYQTYGVPPEIIVGIIGVETRWGRVMGKTRIMDALATLAFNYPRRADYFRSELENLLVMAQGEGQDALSYKGSFAGAMGYGQFMPSAFKQYAVDFNGDGHINLWDPVDAIGSVAHYFQASGWVAGGQVAVQANGQASGLEPGYDKKYSLATLSAAGLSPLGSLGNHSEASLLRLDMGTHYQYWFGLPNFYVITRYNHNTYYAMAVWQLGLSVKQARGGF